MVRKLRVAAVWERRFQLCRRSPVRMAWRVHVMAGGARTLRPFAQHGLPCEGGRLKVEAEFKCNVFERDQ